MVINYQQRWNLETEFNEKNSSGDSETYLSEGTWDWLGGEGEVKRKSQVIFYTLKSTDTYSSIPFSFISNYSGSEAPLRFGIFINLKIRKSFVKKVVHLIIILKVMIVTFVQD